MSSARRRAVAAGLALLSIAAPLSPPAAAADAVSCQYVHIPVSLGGQRETMFGRLCRPARPTSTVLLLVPGATYTNAYWDLPPNLGRSPSAPG